MSDGAKDEAERYGGGYIDRTYKPGDFVCGCVVSAYSGKVRTVTAIIDPETGIADLPPQRLQEIAQSLAASERTRQRRERRARKLDRASRQGSS